MKRVFICGSQKSVVLIMIKKYDLLENNKKPLTFQGNTKFINLMYIFFSF